MTDRELLELAAKAAGYEPLGMENGKMYLFGVQDGWNPLIDDGDALRLAVKLGLCVAIFPKDHETMVGYPKGEHDGANIIEPHNSDPFAATRRAIVRAAAAVGKELK